MAKINGDELEIFAKAHNLTGARQNVRCVLIYYMYKIVFLKNRQLYTAKYSALMKYCKNKRKI